MSIHRFPPPTQEPALPVDKAVQAKKEAEIKAKLAAAQAKTPPAPPQPQSPAEPQTQNK